MFQYLKDLDTQLFFSINGAHFPMLDSVMQALSNKLFWIPMYALLLGLIIKKFKQKTILILPFIALSIALSDQICLHVFKEVFKRLRPCHNTLIQAKIHLLEDCGGLYGFVSSHAANTFALALFASLLLSDAFRKINFLFIWAALVAYSRIYLGKHYPADVAIGALVGLFTAYLSFYLYRIISKKLKNV